MIKKEEYMRFLKKYQKVHCQAISLLNKSDLKKLAEKHGFNNPETKQDETKQDETKNSLTEGKTKQEKPKKAKVVPPSPTLEQVRKMIKDHDVSSEIQVAMSGSDYKKWRAEDKRLHKMLDPFKKVKS
jgi:TFIIF-interacting CTD phosphatase-like protein